MEDNSLAISQKLLHFGKQLAVEYGNIFVTVKTGHNNVILTLDGGEDKRENKLKLHNGRGVNSRDRRKMKREEERNEREETVEGTELDSIQPVPQLQQPLQQPQQSVQQDIVLQQNGASFLALDTESKQPLQTTSAMEDGQSTNLSVNARVQDLINLQNTRTFLKIQAEAATKSDKKLNLWTGKDESWRPPGREVYCQFCMKIRLHIHYCVVMCQYVYINDAARILMCDKDLGKMDCMDMDIYTDESCLFTSAREPSTISSGTLRTSQEFQIFFREIAGVLRELKMKLKRPIEKMEEKEIAKEDILHATACQEKELEETWRKAMDAASQMLDKLYK